ncbi:enoyl-CoA hydratase-related protein [Alkalihalophilus marmarensis]|jgi:enoyl-CoA hydratase/carnithine racemase|uniref:enoyl-CoA hydratase/isomerase family protein n=1 Tax=Alkalihalophilus marmarensis TaxID=521377 RepID=UPI002040924F|nr:enoyl-CoA hydratase-related protein [Alkalihalophilus marmarensis]MCM3491612.1 enoyl-CoA hydratase-related protein [Alkalihalophilus marmarensis]
MGETRLVTYEMNSNLATLTINHSPLNVLIDEVITQLDIIMRNILAEPTCRALVIRAAGEKAFVAGADIRQFPSLTETSGMELVEKGKKVFDRIAHAPFPVICAINGLALGAGLELALACDIRIAEKKAKLGLPETSLGILPGYAGTQRLARLVGPGKAKQMIFTGVPISAVEAYEYGLIEEVAEDGESYQAALKLAEQIISKGPVAISKAKLAIDQGLEGTLEEGQKLESRLFSQLCLTEDMQEGVKAFKEKRAPQFRGE